MSTKMEVVSWLRQKEPVLLNSLEEIGRTNKSGLQRRVKDRVYFDQRHGEYTGAKLCVFASGVMERALGKKFGDRIDTHGVEILPKRRVERCDQYMSHRILRIGIPNENCTISADATYRQYSFQSGSRIVLIPSEHEEEYYGGRIREVLVRGETWVEAIIALANGWYDNLKVKDFEKLVEVLLT